MEKIIETTDLYDVLEFTVQEKRIKYQAVLARVNEYLDDHLIAGERYKATGVDSGSPTGNVVVRLERVVGTDIDEDFDDDDGWNAFCSDMAKQLGVRRFDVPLNYYSK